MQRFIIARKIPLTEAEVVESAFWCYHHHGWTGYDGWSATDTWGRAKYLVWKIQTSGGNTIKSTNRASVKEL